MSTADELSAEHVDQYFVTAPGGFTNAMLRERVAALHDPGSGGYTTSQMTYDPRRLRLKRLIRRLPGKNRYVLTLIGRRVGPFFTKTFARILRPGIRRLDPDLPPDPTDELATAWRDLDDAVDNHIGGARIAARPSTCTGRGTCFRPALAGTFDL